MRKAKLSDLKLGCEIIVNCGGKNQLHIIRKRLDKSELKKHKITWNTIEETEQEYQIYRSWLTSFQKSGFLFINE